MGIGANRHALTAVSSDDRPVVITRFRIDFPAQHAIIDFPIIMRNGLAGAVLSAFFTDQTEIQYAGIWLV